MPPFDIERLQDLQEIDLLLDALRSEFADIESALADHAEIEAARQNSAALTKTQEQASAALLDAELTLATLTAEVEEKSKRLYSGTVVSSRELEALQADIAQLMQQRSVREESALQAMLASEEAEAARDTQQQHLAALAATFATREKEFGARLQELKKEIPKREVERMALAEQSDRALLVPYESMRKRLGGRVLVLVSQGRCTFCNISLPDTQLRRTQHNQEIIYCDNCGRLLYSAS